MASEIPSTRWDSRESTRVPSMATETPRASPAEKSDDESQTQIRVAAARAADVPAATVKSAAPRVREKPFTTFSA